MLGYSLKWVLSTCVWVIKKQPISLLLSCTFMETSLQWSTKPGKKKIKKWKLKGKHEENNWISSSKSTLPNWTDHWRKFDSCFYDLEMWIEKCLLRWLISLYQYKSILPNWWCHMLITLIKKKKRMSVETVECGGFLLWNVGPYHLAKSV